MAPTADDHRNTHDGFPGGRPRLPRLSRPKRGLPTDEPEQAATATEPDEAADAAAELDIDGTFEDYFSTESLFGASPDREETDGPDDAYRVLGVTRQASWKEISQTHRQLVSMLHPDRYVDAAPETREAAERRVRDVNEAYSEIRRQRSATGV